MTNLEKVNELYKTKKYEDCIPLFKEIYSTKEEISVDIFARFSISCRMIKDFKKSEEIINKGLEEFPENNWLTIELAALRNREEKWGDAVKLWEKVKNNSKEFSELNFERYLIALYAIKNKQKVKTILKEALLKFPNNKMFLEKATDVPTTYKHDINILKTRWDFYGINDYYHNSLKENNKLLFEYFIFLADTGQLNKVYKLIQNYDFSYLEDLINSTTYKSDKKNNMQYLLNYYKNDFIPNLVNISPDSLESKIIYFINQKNNDSLLYVKDLIIKQPSVFKKNGRIQMLLNFFVNELIENNLLDEIFAYRLIEFYCEDNNINKTRKKYMISTLIDYFEKKGSYIFFNYLNSNKGYIQKLASTIHRFGENEDAAKYYQRKLHLLVKYSSINYKSPIKKPRVAVCISGMIRGNAKKIFDVMQKNIIKPLNADVFMHTWDVQHEWMGIGGDINWVYRLFGGEVLKKCPNELKLKPFLEKNFPNIYDKIKYEIVSQLDKDILNNLISTKLFEIEDENSFLDELHFPKENLMTRGHYNQAKMFYGIYKSMKVMEEYENVNNIKYDYVIRCRPDIGLNNELNLESLIVLEENEVMTDFYPYGPQDQFRAGRRDTMFTLANIWLEMLKKERLSPFNEYPKIDAHNLIYLWMIHNNMISVPTNIKRDVSLAARESKLPCIKNELEKDIKQIPKEYKERDDFIDFFKSLMEKT